MKISKRDAGLLLLLVGLIGLIVVYNFVYNKNLDKISQENAKLAEIQKTEKALSDLEQNRPFYDSEIERMNAEDAEIIAHYPAGVLPENEIMYAVELEEQTKTGFSAISYGLPVELTTGYEEQTNVRAYDVTMGLTYQTSYQGLKDMILYNKDRLNRMVFNTVTAAYDSTTGNLNGTMTLDQYYIEGTDNVYVEPYVPAMKIGTDNIFGSMNQPAAPAQGE